MNRSSLSLFGALIGVIALTISAAPTSADAAPTPACTTYAGMVDGDGDGFCAFVGSSTAASTGWTGKVDCRDDVKAINPGATELIGDGIDQDCSGSDLVYPVPEPVAQRYLANSGAANPVSFIEEYDRCKAATGRCSVDDTTGAFVIANPDVDTFADIYIGGTKVLRADGVREVVTLEEQSHFRPGGSASLGSTGIGTKTATRIADERAALAVKAEEEARKAADEALDGRVKVLEQDAIAEDKEDDERDAEISRLGQAQTGLAERQAVQARQIAGLQTDVSFLQTTTAGLRTDVDQQGASGIAVNAGIAGGMNSQRARSFDEQDLRGPVTGSGGFDVAIQVDLDDMIAGPFATLTWGSDGVGSGLDTGLLVGFEALGDISDSGHHLGGGVAFRHTEAMSNYLDTAVPANGACAVASYRYQAPSAGPVAISPWLRVGPCGESYASKHARLAEDNSVEVVVAGGQGAGMTAMGGVSFNLTSVRRR